ncbi:dynamin family protein [Vibrio sp. SG41-7]|uniref:dynamin family protein n=1 Tax=Vibrio sp. SG41-7 TaxID=2760973 RepID=UPI0016049863|nr:dynamin family protein [Vibrio sp. SG41-7]MBB1466433.1 dynamin family protein [Vibrio sp. SG41-7]
MDKNDLTQFMREFLVGLRTKASMSQADVSKRSGMEDDRLILDQKGVSRIENNPLDGDTYKIAAYMTAVGSTLEAYSSAIQQAVQLNRGQKNMETTTKTNQLILIDDTLKKVAKAKAHLHEFEHEYTSNLGLAEALNQSVLNLEGLKRKPVIGFFGHYDSGKSTLINTVVNNEFLPVKYQPATSIVNMLVHKDDKPDFLSGDVALFRKGFLPHMISDRTKVSEYLIEEGGKEILDKYGVHDWDDQTMTDDAYLSVSYLDAPILHRAWLLDTPGNLNDSETQDTDFAISGVELVDGVVFLSQHSGYMNGPSVSFLADIIRKRIPSSKRDILEHIALVKTHCHSGMSPQEIKEVELLSMKRVYKYLDTTVFDSWKADGCIAESPSPQMLADITCSFWRETDILREGTLEAISKMSYFLMENQDALVKQRVQDVELAIQGTITACIEKLRSLKASGEQRLAEVETQDARFREKSGNLIEKFKELIISTNQTETECNSELKIYYNSLVSESNIESLIEDNFDDKKDAEQGIGGVISQLLSRKLENTLKTNSVGFNNQIDQLLVSWQSIIPTTIAVDSSIDMNGMKIDGFDSRSAFVGGLAGVGSLGAMALYVSGITSNLGAYILVGKAAGVLTSLGLASSVTSVTSFVAAIGGPITIGVVIASAIGYAVYRLFGGKWQSSLAKKIRQAVDKKSPLGEIEKVVSSYWTATRQSTLVCLDELQSETEKHIEKMYKEATQEFDLADLDKCISHLQMVLTQVK